MTEPVDLAALRALAKSAAPAVWVKTTDLAALMASVESLRAALRDAYGMLPPERVGLLREPTHDAMTRALAATEPTEREAE